MNLKTLPVLALFAWAAPLAAQETPEEPAEEPAAEAPAEAAPEGEVAPEGEATEPADELDMGEPRVGQEYARDTIGDWTILCVKQEQPPEPCQMGQLLTDAENGNPLAEIRMAPAPEGAEAAAVAIITAPLMTLLTEGLGLSVDGGPETRYGFYACTERGCIARVGLTQELLDAFRAGNEATLTIVPAQAPDQVVRASISLTGFTDAFESGSLPPEDPEQPAE